MRFFLALVFATTWLLMPCQASNLDFGGDFKGEQTFTLEAVVTAYYTPEEDQDEYATGSFKGDVKLNGKGRTFYGGEATVGTIAADPKFLLPGTAVFVPGYGMGIVQDIGSAIKGRKIDLHMGKGEEALEKAIAWGEKVLDIVIFPARRRGA